MSETRTDTAAGVLIDEVRESPVDRYLERHRRRLLLVLLLIVLALVVWYLAERRPGGGRQGRGHSGYARGPAAAVSHDVIAARTAPLAGDIAA